MSRGTTPNLSLGVWDEKEDAGAGSKTVPTGNTGINGNWLTIDASVGVGHNADGSHKADVIDGPSLKTTVADNSTLELTGTPLKLQVKDDGVTGTKIAAAFADGSTLECTASSGAKTIRIKDAGVTKAKLHSGVADGTTIELDATNGLQIVDGGVTNEKLADGDIGPEKLEYIECVMLLSQATTSAPVETLVSINRGISPPWGTWSRTGVGEYTYTLGSAPLAANKTVFLIGEMPHPSYGHTITCVERIATNTLVVKTFRADTGAQSDSVLNGVTLLIRIYP